MILAVDPGIRTFGWAIVTSGTGAVVRCGVLIQDKDDKLSSHADREARAKAQADLLSDLVVAHRVSTLVAEQMSFAPKAQAAALIGIGLSWGVLIGVASNCLTKPVRTIPPKVWQRAIVPLKPGEKRGAAVDYDEVYAELARYVDVDTLLADVAPSHRNHALDACGVGVYAAIVDENPLHVKPRKERSA